MKSSKQKKTTTISISAAIGENNAGDDIIVISLIKGITARFKEHKIILFTANQKATTRILVREGISLESVKTVYSGRWGLFDRQSPPFLTLLWIIETFWWIYRSDLFLIGPGMPIHDANNRFKLLFYLSKAILAWCLKTPYAFVCIGVGEVRWSFSRYLLKIFGNGAIFISVRDTTSLRELSRLGIEKSKKVKSLADLSFSDLAP